MKNIFWILRVTAKLFIVLIAVIGVQAQISDKELLETRINFAIERTSAFNHLNEISRDYRIPIGFEKLFKENKTIQNIRTEPGTLEEVLNSFSLQIPKYAWEVKNGVVVVRPVGKANRRLSDFLDIKLDNVSITKEGGFRGVASILDRNSKLKKYLDENKLHLTCLIVTGPYATLAELPDLEFGEITVRDLLGELQKYKVSISPFWTAEITDDESLILVF